LKPERRLAIVASHVIQYQAPFFRLLAQETGLDLRVLYCSRRGDEPYHDADMRTTLRWDLDLLTGYRHVFLRNFGWGNSYWRLLNPGIMTTLPRGGYDAVIFFVGWGTVSSILGMATCWLAGIPFFLFSDSSFLPATDSLPSRLRERALRGLCRRACAFLISGALNARYYEHYGADPLRFFPLPWAIDNERFETASRFAPGEREAMRTRFGVAPHQTAIAFAGKLIPRKGPMMLLEAVHRMVHRDRVVVVFLGQGELRDPLEEYARSHGVQVHFPGFVNQADLPKHYAAADIFVLPSFDDPRATVINEAMACGLPVVVSDRCGPIGDIARDGDNAFVFHAGDTDALAAALDRLTVDPALRLQMSARSREIISRWDYQRGVEGVREALAKCLTRTS
jgi:glycosyltransferase involved in cell wall biosynthesis